MLSLQHLPSLSINLLSPPPTLLFAGFTRTNPVTNDHVACWMSRELRLQHGQRCWSVITRAVENREDSQKQEYEIDQDKAREALSKLDQQLESLSKKRVPTPKIRASDIKLAWDRMVPEEEEAPEFSGSSLAYVAVALLAFTIFYNVLFYTVIKPSVDGAEEYSPDQTPLVRPDESPGAKPMGFSSPIISSTAAPIIS